MRRNAAVSRLARRPYVLVEASFDRLAEAQWMLERGSWPIAMYLAGLSIEALLQALAIRRGQAHDARHDLALWLNKCPVSLADALRSGASVEWSTLRSVWDNDLRYLSFSGVLGRLRERGLARGVKTGVEGGRSVVKVHTQRCVAALIHSKGIVVWRVGKLN